MAGKDWTDVSEFDGVALTESWLMAFWPGPDRSFVWRVDFELTGEHRAYRKPATADHSCIRSGSIILRDCKWVAMAASNRLLPNFTEGFAFGEIRSCKVSDHEISLEAENVSFRIEYGSYSIEFDEE